MNEKPVVNLDLRELPNEQQKEILGQGPILAEQIEEEFTKAQARTRNNELLASSVPDISDPNKSFVTPGENLFDTSIQILGGQVKKVLDTDVN